MCAPSGEKTGCDSLLVRFVSGLMSPESTSRIWIVLLSLSPVYAVATFTNASLLPSDDHETGDDGAPGGKVAGSVHVPEVSRFAALLPSTATSQRCTGRGVS